MQGVTPGNRLVHMFLVSHAKPHVKGHSLLCNEWSRVLVSSRPQEISIYCNSLCRLGPSSFDLTFSPIFQLV